MEARTDLFIDAPVNTIFIIGHQSVSSSCAIIQSYARLHFGQQSFNFFHSDARDSSPQN
jgi:hypothetical protein